jgi:hypothetical protein
MLSMCKAFDQLNSFYSGAIESCMSFFKKKDLRKLFTPFIEAKNRLNVFPKIEM